MNLTFENSTSKNVNTAVYRKQTIWKFVDVADFVALLFFYFFCTDRAHTRLEFTGECFIAFPRRILNITRTDQCNTVLHEIPLSSNVYQLSMVSYDTLRCSMTSPGVGKREIEILGESCNAEQIRCPGKPS